jgi:E3 ubiquitin-protein ligase DOA10
MDNTNNKVAILCEELNKVINEKSYCYICREESNSKNMLCDCIGEISYAHTSCITDWIKMSNNNKCAFCFKQYKIPFMISFDIIFTKLTNNITEIYNNILNLNLYTSVSWDEGG